MSLEAESYAFASSIYGGRPTFGLTRRHGDDGAELTLYEFTPKNIAEARSERFRRVGERGSVTTVALSDAVADGTDPSTGCVSESSTGPSADDWDWSGWCAIKIATLRGKQMKAVQSLVRDTLSSASRDATPILSGSPDTLCLPEGVGVRLSLAFLGLKPLRRYEKLNEFSDALSRMSVEECYYWHAKARSPNSPNGIKALRVLLTDHVN